MERDKILLEVASPCDTDLYDATIKTTADARAIGRNICPHYYKCIDTGVYCTLRFGTDAAKYVSQGSTLKAELKEIRNSGLLEGKTFVNSTDRKVFEEIEGADKILTEIERVAGYLLEQSGISCT